MDPTPPVETTTPVLGALVPTEPQRVDQVASTFATMAEEARVAALSYREDMQREVLAQVARETPERNRQAQHGGGNA